MMPFGKCYGIFGQTKINKLCNVLKFSENTYLNKLKLMINWNRIKKFIVRPT